MLYEKTKQNKKALQELYHSVKEGNKGIVGIQKRNERGRGGDEEFIQRNNRGKLLKQGGNTHFHVTKRMPCCLNKVKPTQKHTVVKLSSIKE